MDKSLFFLFLLLVPLLANAVDYAHPLFATSFANANENQTLYRFRILNNESTPTLPFRVWLASDMNWFDHSVFTYGLQPDGTDGPSPYWDLPPVYPNESTEVSFRVNRTVGLPGRVTVTTKALDKWSGECGVVPYNGTNGSDAEIESYLLALNKTSNVTLYYEENGYVLAMLDQYGTYAVFRLDNVSMVNDSKIVSGLVADYAKSATKSQPVNLSGIKDALEESVLLKSQPEKDCYRISGMDRFPCVDRDTCIYSCFSVPVCSSIGQSGWSFLDTLLDYNKTVYDADAKLEHAIAISADLELMPSYGKAKEMFQGLIDLNRAETAVIYHPLFTSYGFCEPAEYGILQQMGARRALLDYLELNCLYGEEDAIVNESLHTAAVLNPPNPKPRLNNTNMAWVQNISVVQNGSTTNRTPDNETAGDGTVKRTEPGSEWWVAVLIIAIVAGAAFWFLGRKPEFAT